MPSKRGWRKGNLAAHLHPLPPEVCTASAGGPSDRLLARQTYRAQRHVVSCLDALAVALGNVVELTLILVMIQRDDLHREHR